MRRWVTGLLVLLVVAGGTGWHYRASIKAWISPPVSAENPAKVPDVLYSWVDKDGVTHYSQQPSKKTAQRVEYDGSRITPVDVVEAPLLPTEPEATGEDASTGNPVLDMRKELERNARKMQEAKAAQRDF